MHVFASVWVFFNVNWPFQDADFVLQVAVSQVLPLETLEGVQVAGVLLPHHVHLREGAAVRERFISWILSGFFFPVSFFKMLLSFSISTSSLRICVSLCQTWAWLVCLLFKAAVRLQLSWSTAAMIVVLLEVDSFEVLLSKRKWCLSIFLSWLLLLVRLEDSHRWY